MKLSKGGKLTEQKQTGWTFEMFWVESFPDGRQRNRWPKNSSRKIAERRWNQMSQSQRDKAGNHIDVYMRNIPGGQATKLAESYLSAELWNN